MYSLVVFLTLFLTVNQDVIPGGSKVYEVYPVPSEIADTKAPKGYSPFYITHYGRHGSRYLESAEQNHVLSDVLEKAATMGGLTAEGEALLQDLKVIDAKSQGHYGQITDRGAAEQKGIGMRMAQRFPSVFSNPGRQQLTCVSSLAQRCIMSMANFTASLISAHPGLNPEFLCGEKYMSYIIDLPKSIEFKHLSQEVADEEFAKRFDFNAFLGRFLKNPADAEGLITDKRLYVQHLMFNASDAVCIGGCPDLKHYFTEKEFVEIGNIYDIFLYGHLCNAKATGRLNMSDSVTLLTDFVTKADEAVSGNSIAADIRFGHDSALLNFLCMIGLKGFDTNVDLRDAVSCFNSSELMPMASNIQLVFYRSKRGGDVLVKVLYNEKETCLPGLGPGPYYSWKDLRSYLVGRMDKYRLQ